MIIKILDDAGVQGGARKAILTFEKTITTLRNMMYDRNTSPSRVTSSKPADKARELLKDFNNEGGSWSKGKEPKYWEEWKKYMESYGKFHNTKMDYMTNLLDHLA